MANARHWEQVYRTKAVDRVSWYQDHAERSLVLIRATGLAPGAARIIDVGAGASVLVDDLPEAGYDIWHDRAVFHFLTKAEDRRRYVEQVRRAVRPGGYVIVATFGPNGPLQCSDLEVCRYAPEALHGEFSLATS